MGPRETVRRHRHVNLFCHWYYLTKAIRQYRKVCQAAKDETMSYRRINRILHKLDRVIDNLEAMERN